MANEIKVQIGFRASKGGLLIDRPVKSFSADMEGEYTTRAEQLIGTVAEPLTIVSDLTSPGFAWFKNLDDTAHNTIQIGVMSGSTFIPFLELHVGDPPNWCSIADLDLYAKADSAPAILQYEILER